MRTSSIVAALAASTCIVALATPAHAQQRTYNVPAGSLKSALEAFGRQSGRPIIFKADEVRGTRSPGYRGSATAQHALGAILSGTGFTMRLGDADSIAIVRVGNGQSADSQDSESAESIDNGATPEILVTGTRQWTLNTDIKRTRDDAQPYVIFDRDQIQRSGATNLEDFFRDNLTGDTNGTLNTQRAYSDQKGNISLRGLGPDQTLILVDGRRIAPRKGFGGLGTLDQPNITGIPLAAIERIEVLASSASGIYGGNATGGVINIILKRDYSGLEVSANYGSTYGGGGGQRRVDLTAGTNFFGGRTNVMLTGSWQKTDPLTFGQRDFYSDYRRRLYDLNPSQSGGVPLGATPNIRSSTGAALTLKPQFGGTSLGSAFTSVPYGYRGVGLDGVAPLVANAGTYNWDLAPTSQSAGTIGLNGRDTTFINSTENFSGTLAIRQEVTPWLKAFVEVAGSENRGTSYQSTIPTQITLAANAPNNPFQQAIIVQVPQIGYSGKTSFKAQELRATGGVIANLPFGWSGSADYGWNKNWTSFDLPRPVTRETLAGINAGTLDVLRDLAVAPLSYPLTELSSFSRPAPTTTSTISLRLAGPLPVSLPGGKPTLTLQAQRTNTNQAGVAAYSVTTGATSTSTVASYYLPRRQTADAVYFEARLPIFGSLNHFPLLNELEVQIAARYERYQVTGARNAATCFSFNRPLTDADLDLPCPPENLSFPQATSARASFNPTYSLKWRPVPDLMFRASYATGYRPPSAAQLIKVATNTNLVAGVTDPLRGNEPIGVTPVGATGLYYIAGYNGGNPDVRPERSRSYTAGAVLTPRAIPNLRLSIDWTKTIKRDNYFAPTTLFLMLTPTAAGQKAVEDFMRAYPDRFIRSGNPGAYSVAPVTSIDMSYVNLSGASAGAVDFAADYSSKVGRGNLDFSLAATWLYDLTSQLTLSSPSIQYAGAVPEGGPEWKGNATIRYSNDDWSVGLRANYFGGYWLDSNHASLVSLGSNRVDAQTYFDVFASYRLSSSTSINGGVRNVLNKRPLYDPRTNGLFSPYADPRGGTYYLSISQKF